MNKNNVLKMDNGVLYLKLQEDFNPDTLEVHTITAKVDIESVVIAIPQKSSSITLSHNAIEMLGKGSNMVETYWDTKPTYRKVLLSCGCILDWDEYIKDLDDDEEGPPIEGEDIYCEECEDEVLILRFNSIDFQ